MAARHLSGIFVHGSKDDKPVGTPSTDGNPTGTGQIPNSHAVEKTPPWATDHMSTTSTNPLGGLTELVFIVLPAGSCHETSHRWEQIQSHRGDILIQR